MALVGEQDKQLARTKRVLQEYRKLTLNFEVKIRVKNPIYLRRNSTF
jgi:hypothetical protein